MVFSAQDGNNRLSFYSAQEPTKRLLVGVEEGAELWDGRTMMWLCLCSSSPSILEGAGWERGRSGCAQEGGKQHLTMLTTVLSSLSTGGNYSSLSKTESTENEFRKLSIKCIFARGLADYNYLSSKCEAKTF